MDASIWGDLRSYLAHRGYSQEWIQDVTGTNPNEYTRYEMSVRVINALMSRMMAGLGAI